MKELHRIDDISINIYDGYNFCVYKAVVIKTGKNKGKIVQKDKTYHAKLHHALSEAALRVAGQAADTMEQYINIYRDTARSLAKATGGI